MRLFPEVTFVLFFGWSVSGVVATLIERGIGHRYGKIWDERTALVNILTVQRSAVKHRSAWMLILLARVCMALLVVLLIVSLARSVAN